MLGCCVEVDCCDLVLLILLCFVDCDFSGLGWFELWSGNAVLSGRLCLLCCLMVQIVLGLYDRGLLLVGA